MSIRPILLTLLASIAFSLCLITTSCNNNVLESPSQAEFTENTVDSLAITLHEMDSMLNSGKLSHLDVYEIGKLKNISVSVQKITVGEDSEIWINFRKDCGSQYYYSWENARLLLAECSYLIDALSTIQSNKSREVDHEERYAYVTKDDIRLLSYATKGKLWTMELSVDRHKQNSTITLNDQDVDNLKDLIQKAQLKIKEIM